MSKRTGSASTWGPNPSKRKKKRTSVGHSKNSRPKNKHKKRSTKRYKGQGK